MNSPDTLNLAALPFYQWDTFVAPQSDPEVGVVPAMLDSIFCEHDSVVYRPSLFSSHSLMPQDRNLTPRPDSTTAPWIFGVLVLLTALLCLYYRMRKITFGPLLTALVDSRAMDRMLRNNNMTRSIQLFPMGMLTVAVVALTLQPVPLWQYLLLTAGLIVAYALRNGLMRFLATVFDNSGAVSTYVISNYLYHLTLATLLLPMLFLHFYLPRGGEMMLYVMVGLVAVEFLTRLVRGLKLFLTQSSGAHFYLFYYLCIVEIVPILVLLKLFIL